MIKARSCETVFELAEKQKQIKSLEKKMQDKKVWNDYKLSGEISQELEELKNVVLSWQEIENNLKGLKSLVNSNNSKADDIQDEEELEFIKEQYVELKAQIARVEEELQFSGKYDKGGAIMTLHPGPEGQMHKIGQKCY